MVANNTLKVKYNRLAHDLVITDVDCDVSTASLLQAMRLIKIVFHGQFLLSCFNN